MIASSTARRLTSPAFVVALLLLILNDWVLKPAFGNWLTGKLSDVAGLLAFALFWFAFFPRHPRSVITVTAVGFTFFKSPLANPLLSAWNALTVWPMYRVIDYSDLFALIVLVPVYVLVASSNDSVQPLQAQTRPFATLTRRMTAVCTGIVAVLAFAATSRPVPSYDISTTRPEGFVVSASHPDVLAGLKATGLYQFEFGMTPRDQKKNPGLRMMTIYIRQPPERDIGVDVEIREVSPGETRIRLLEVSTGGPQPNNEAVVRAFERQVMDPLHKWLSERPSSR